VKIPVGVSSCLMGEPVRYDGGHKLDTYITQTLSKYFDFKGFCPEVAIGMGVPRQPIRLVRGDSNSIQCVAVDNPANDVTQRLEQCAADQHSWHRQLCGYIVKKNSPSCGMEQVKTWPASKLNAGLKPKPEGVGIYARKLMENFPNLPVEDEGRLGDFALRENFIQRVFALHRWLLLEEQGRSVAALTGFHERHKGLIMSHDQDGCDSLDELIRTTTGTNLEARSANYLSGFMQSMKKNSDSLKPR
jgi:uncharacterized protein YbbK (DUF523 family)